MKKEVVFKKSAKATIGVELEFQIIDLNSYCLKSRAHEIIKNISEKEFQIQIKPELTQSMIEINSSVHSNIPELAKELHQLYNFLLNKCSSLGVTLCGGGTHPFQKWTNQEIFLTDENKIFSEKYKYLAKRATVFGQHIHIGCINAEEALYLTHALAYYVPHFIAISASSPFYQKVNTGFVSARSNVFNAFPVSGVVPFLKNWEEFLQYFYKMRQLKVIEDIDDFLWDIRPQPRFGTVEVRVCDTPLTLKKAILIASYIQTLSLYLLEEKPIKMTQDLYFLYNHNRFQASRDGFKGNLIDPYTSKHRLIGNDILITLQKIKNYAKKLHNEVFIDLLRKEVEAQHNDAVLLKEVYKSTNSFQAVVSRQCEEWLKSATENILFLKF